jgi:hypothetical protein
VTTVGGITFDLVVLAEGADFAASTGRWLFFAFAVAFAVKVPVFPLHTWLPDAHTQAPTAGSVVLAGVMLKLGTYGLLRFGLYLFPEASVWSRPLWLTLGVIGIIYGAIVATMQRDLKRLVAYSSVAHLGFIVLGTFAITSRAIGGGVLQMINHGVSTGALFLLVGMIYERRHTRQISELKGLQKVAPIFAAVFMLVMLSSIGVPGLNGFVGEFLILIGPSSPPAGGRGGHDGRDPRRALPAVGVPAGVPRRARRGQQGLFRDPLEGGLVLLPFLAGHRVLRHLPQADARPHRAERRGAHRPHRGAHRLRRARWPTRHRGARRGG